MSCDMFLPYAEAEQDTSLFTPIYGCGRQTKKVTRKMTLETFFYWYVDNLNQEVDKNPMNSF